MKLKERTMGDYVYNINISHYTKRRSEGQKLQF